jgi:hypothetical protein
LHPPADLGAGRGVRGSPPVWAVSEAVAKIIALAELNRWMPGRMQTQLWRNPSTCSKYATESTVSGSGNITVWTVVMQLPPTEERFPADSAPQERPKTGMEQFQAKVSSMGKVLSLERYGAGGGWAAMSPLRQFRRDPPFTYKWVG